MIYRAELKSMAKEQIKGNIGILFLINLIFVVLSAAVSLVPIFGIIVVSVVTPAITIGIINIYLGLTRGEKPQVERMFSGMPIFGKAFLLYLVTQILISLWMLLFIIPGIIKAIAYMFAPYILAENPEMGVLDAIRESKEMTNGHKMDLFILMLSFIIWILVIFVTFGLAAIYVAPYMQATIANAYNALKKGSSRVINVSTPEMAPAAVSIDPAYKFASISELRCPACTSQEINPFNEKELVEYQCNNCKNKFESGPLQAPQDETLPYPCTVIFERLSGYSVSAADLTVYLNGAKVGRIGSGQAISFQTFVKRNIIFVADHQGSIFGDAYRFGVEPGATVIVRFDNKFI